MTAIIVERIDCVTLPSKNLVYLISVSTKKELDCMWIEKPLQAVIRAVTATFIIKESLHLLITSMPNVISNTP